VKVSECCSAGWDEDTGICLACKEHSEGVHDNDFDHYEEMATENGWVVPVNDAFDDQTWVTYWKAMEESKNGGEEGRPIPPHRSA
jgi:hypothetical protein